MTLKHAKTSAAGASSDPTKVGGDDWNADHVLDANGLNLPGTAGVPVTPAAGTLQLYAQTVGGDTLPAYVTPDGRANMMQPYLGRKRITMLTPDLNLGAPSNQTGFCTFSRLSSTGGGASGGLPTDNGIYAQRWARLVFGSGATAGSYVSLVSNSAYLTRGSQPGMGGFRVVCRWAPVDPATVAGARSFVGLAQSTFNNADPSLQVSLIGVGCDSGDTTLSVFCNDGSGTATKIACGANFPDNGLGTDVYEVMLYNAPNSAQVAVLLTRLRTGDVFNTVLSTNLPTTGTPMNIFMTRANASTALVVNFSVYHVYAEVEV